jgi:two-component system chemotaxis response regulator CheY
MGADKAMNVLVVDTYPAMRRIIRNLLAEIGFSNVDEAGGGQAALEMAARKKYGLIISDWHMEPVSGIELLRGIRAGSNDNKSVVFILVTAETKAESILLAKQAGVNGCIIKPFNAETLKNKISAILGAV